MTDWEDKFLFENPPIHTSKPTKIEKFSSSNIGSYLFIFLGFLTLILIVEFKFLLATCYTLKLWIFAFIEAVSLTGLIMSFIGIFGILNTLYSNLKEWYRKKRKIPLDIHTELKRFWEPDPEITPDFLITTLISIAISIPFVLGFFIENTQIHSFYEADYFTENYIVTASKESNDTPNRKTYSLTAEIVKGNSSDDYIYCIRHLRANNGKILHYNCISELRREYYDETGYTFFDYEQSEQFQLIPGKEKRVTDSNENTWYLTLTTKKSENIKLSECKHCK